MDQIYFWIIILFLMILVLDYTDKYYKKNEHFSQYYEENRLYVYEPPYSTNAVNINSNQNLHFKNFTTNGITPPFVKCPSCNLQFDCSNYPYDVDDKNATTCTRCSDKVSLDNNNLPVYAKSVGKPRVCKNLL